MSKLRKAIPVALFYLLIVVVSATITLAQRWWEEKQQTEQRRQDFHEHCIEEGGTVMPLVPGGVTPEFHNYPDDQFLELGATEKCVTPGVSMWHMSGH